MQPTFRKALVTGGAGFIGSHIARTLVRAGVEVTILDDFSTGLATNLTRLGIASDVRIQKGSVLDESIMRDAIAGSDVIFHFAAVVGVPLILASPNRAFSVNVLGTRNVCRIATEHRVKLVFASSSEVYGADDSRKLTETSRDDMIGNLNIYGLYLDSSIRW